MSQPRRRWLFPNHPAGLGPLFNLEICERMSFYGMAAILVLYLMAPQSDGGAGFTENWSKMLYSMYTGAVYLTPLLGGFIADRWLGARRTMVIGGIVIAVGHFMVAFQSLPMFFSGLVVIAIGTGLLKPNVNTMLGHLYPEGHKLRSAGFSLLYMAINIGAAAAPIICGTMAQSAWFKNLLSSAGFNPLHSWHWGFAAAGVGMCVGLFMYWIHRHRLEGVGDAIPRPVKTAAGTKQSKSFFSRQEWHKLGALAFLFVAFTLYCAVSQQAGTSLTTFAQKLTRLSVGEWHFEASHTLALNPVFIVLLTPLFTWLWPFLNGRKLEPSEPLKFAIGMVFLALGTALLVPASWQAVHGLSMAPDPNNAQAYLASPFWLVGVYFFQTVAELFMSPIGNAAATRLAPARFASLTMGIWYTSVALGSFLGGYLSAWCDTSNPGSFAGLFGWMAVGSVVLAGILLALTPTVNKLMSDGSSAPPAGH